VARRQAFSSQPFTRAEPTFNHAPGRPATPLGAPPAVRLGCVPPRRSKLPGRSLGATARAAFAVAAPQTRPRRGPFLPPVCPWRARSAADAAPCLNMREGGAGPHAVESLAALADNPLALSWGVPSLI
jgi:hypothetical protein